MDGITPLNPSLYNTCEQLLYSIFSHVHITPDILQQRLDAFEYVKPLLTRDTPEAIPFILNISPTQLNIHTTQSKKTVNQTHPHIEIGVVISGHKTRELINRTWNTLRLRTELTLPAYIIKTISAATEESPKPSITSHISPSISGKYPHRYKNDKNDKSDKAGQPSDGRPSVTPPSPAAQFIKLISLDVSNRKLTFKYFETIVTIYATPQVTCHSYIGTSLLLNQMITAISSTYQYDAQQLYHKVLIAEQLLCAAFRVLSPHQLRIWLISALNTYHVYASSYISHKTSSKSPTSNGSKTEPPQQSSPTPLQEQFHVAPTSLTNIIYIFASFISTFPFKTHAISITGPVSYDHLKQSQSQLRDHIHSLPFIPSGITRQKAPPVPDQHHNQSISSRSKTNTCNNHGDNGQPLLEHPEHAEGEQTQPQHQEPQRPQQEQEQEQGRKYKQNDANDEFIDSVVAIDEDTAPSLHQIYPYMPDTRQLTIPYPSIPPSSSSSYPPDPTHTTSSPLSPNTNTNTNTFTNSPYLSSHTIQLIVDFCTAYHATIDTNKCDSAQSSPQLNTNTNTNTSDIHTSTVTHPQLTQQTITHNTPSWLHCTPSAITTLDPIHPLINATQQITEDEFTSIHKILAMCKSQLERRIYHPSGSRKNNNQNNTHVASNDVNDTACSSPANKHSQSTDGNTESQEPLSVSKSIKSTPLRKLFSGLFAGVNLHRVPVIPSPSHYLYPSCTYTVGIPSYPHSPTPTPTNSQLMSFLSSFPHSLHDSLTSIHHRHHSYNSYTFHQLTRKMNGYVTSEMHRIRPSISPYGGMIASPSEHDLSFIYLLKILWFIRSPDNSSVMSESHHRGSFTRSRSSLSQSSGRRSLSQSRL